MKTKHLSCHLLTIALLLACTCPVRSQQSPKSPKDIFAENKVFCQEKKYSAMLRNLEKLPSKYQRLPIYLHQRMQAIFSLYSEKYKSTKDTSSLKYDNLLKMMDIYAKLVNLDDKKLHLTEDPKLYKAWRDVIKTEEIAVFLRGAEGKTESLSAYLATVWHDTTEIYKVLFKEPKLSYHSPAAGKNFRKIDSIAKANTPFRITSIQRLANYLTQPYDDEVSKVRSIYMWVATHIKYDYVVLAGKREFAWDNMQVIKRGAGVCSNYASLFAEICEKAGIEAKYIKGSAKGTGYKKGDFVTGDTNHAWNVVKVNNKWHLIEATWAWCLKEYNFYFLANPLHLIYTHRPEDAQWQFLRKPIDTFTFEELPDLYPDSFKKFGNLAPSSLTKSQRDEKKINALKKKLKQKYPKVLA